MGCTQAKLVGFPIDELKTASSITSDELLDSLADKFLELSDGEDVISKAQIVHNFRQGFMHNDPIALESLYYTLDSDRSGGLDFKEYVTWIGKVRRNDVDEITDLTFQMFDINRDGSISQEELEILFNFINNTLEIVEFTLSSDLLAEDADGNVEAHDENYYRRRCREVAAEMVAKYGRRHPGTLGYEEFKEALRQYSFLSNVSVRCLAETRVKHALFPRGLDLSNGMSVEPTPDASPRASVSVLAFERRRRPSEASQGRRRKRWQW